MNEKKTKRYNDVLFLQTNLLINLNILIKFVDKSLYDI